MNLIERSSAPIRSFSVLLASNKPGLPETEKLWRLEPGPPSSDMDELQAVLSVHSVPQRDWPQRDSRSSLALGLLSLDTSLDFMSAASTARKAPSMAEMVLVASWVLVFFLGLGMRVCCETVLIVAKLELWPGRSPLDLRSTSGFGGSGEFALRMQGIIATAGSGEEALPGERRRAGKLPPGGAQKEREISSRPLAWLE